MTRFLTFYLNLLSNIAFIIYAYIKDMKILFVFLFFVS